MRTRRRPPQGLRKHRLRRGRPPLPLALASKLPPGATEAAKGLASQLPSGATKAVTGWASALGFGDAMEGLGSKQQSAPVKATGKPGDPKWAKDFAKTTPVWVAHGAKDIDVHPLFSIKMVESIIKEGGSPKFTLYEDVYHDSWNNVFEDPVYLEWLFSHTKN